MKRCSICVLPESFPGITFHAEGVCSVCIKFQEQKQFIPSIEKLQAKMSEIIQECKSQNLKYDAVVAYSGGKDSTFLIYTLKEKYGLNLLAVTFDNGFMSEYSFKNMAQVLNTLSVDHIIVKPGLEMMKKIFSVCANLDTYPEHLTKFGSSICISCIRMVTNLSIRTALEKKIPMVMLGNSPGQLIQSENEIIYKDNVIPYNLRKNLFRQLAERAGEEAYYYLMLTAEEYKTKPFPYIINAFPLIGYDEVEIYKTIQSLGWKKPEDVDPNSTNCKLNSLGILKHKERLNFHPYDFEMSMLVRMGIITRNQALARVEDLEGKVVSLAQQVAKDLIIEDDKDK